MLFRSADPVYEAHGVVHYAVGNMPGAVPHTSTYALTNATLPYLAAVAIRGVRGAAADPAVRLGINAMDGAYANATVAAALGSTAVDPFA